MQQAAALVWEFFVRARQGILFTLAGTLFWLCLLLSILEKGGTNVDHETVTIMHFAFFWSALIFFGAALVPALSNSNRRYTLPVSSLTIVACSMGCAMVTTFGLYAATTLIVNVIFDAGWTILGPGLAAMAIVAWFHAILWATANSNGLRLLVGLANGGAILYGFGRWTQLRGVSPKGFLTEVRDVHLLLFGLAVCLSLAVGTLGYASLRRGSGIDPKRLVEFASRIFPRAARAKPFASSTSAQFWLEWLERSYVMPLGTGLIGLVMLICAMKVPAWRTADLIGALSVCILSPAAVIGIFLGSRSESGAFGNFNGTRPLSDAQVGNAILKSTTLGLIAALLIWGAFAALTYWVIADGNAIRSNTLNAIRQMKPVTIATQAFLGAAALWSAVNLVTVLTLGGRKVLALALITGIGAMMTGLLIPPYLISNQAAALTFQRWYFSACAILVVSGYAAAIVTSLRLRLLSTGTLAFAALLAVATIIAAQFADLKVELRHDVRVLSICLLLPSPMALAPLAAWFNRHR